MHKGYSSCSVCVSASCAEGFALKCLHFFSNAVSTMQYGFSYWFY